MLSCLWSLTADSAKMDEYPRSRGVHASEESSNDKRTCDFSAVPCRSSALRSRKKNQLARTSPRRIAFHTQQRRLVRSRQHRDEKPTAEQASWSDGKGNHSVGQIAHHLVFWNRWTLERLNGSTEKYNGTNDETFYKFDTKTWNDTVRQFDEVMNDIEKWVQTADEAS